ncbi:MAG: WD40 repeat domain-containing protein, partial [Ilumatobacteraceae bacterium]
TVTSDGVEIAHEALIAAWPRLTEWIDSERDNIVAQQRLTRATTAWQASGEDAADLYRGNKLSAALAWQAESAPVLSPAEAEFLRVSDEHAQDELARQRRNNRRLRILAGTSVVAMVATLSATFVAVGRSRDADRRREQVEAGQLVTVFAADESLSQVDRMRIAAAVHARTPTVDTAGFLLDSILAAPDVIVQSNIDMIALTGSAPTYSSGMAILVLDGNARSAIVDGNTLEVDRGIIGFTPESVVARAEGMLAVRDTTFEVIELPDRRPIGPAPKLDGEPASAVLSSDGTVLAIGYHAGEGVGDPQARIDLFDVASGSSIGRIETTSNTIDELELTSDGSKLIGVFDDVALELWDIASDERLVRTSIDPSLPAVTSSAFNRLGDAVAVGRGDGTIEIWRQADGSWRRASTARRHTDAVTWIEFDGADALVISSSRDGSVVMSDASDGSLRNGPVQFDASGSLASYFDPQTGDVVTIDSLGKTWRWSAGSGGALVTIVEVASGSPPSIGTPHWVGVSKGAAVAVDDATVGALGVGQGAVDVVGGRSGDYVVVYPDRLDWHRPEGELVMSVEAGGSMLDRPLAVNGRMIAYLEPQPENEESNRIVVLTDDGTTIDEIEIKEIRGDVTRLDLSLTGDDLVYSTSTGQLIWYSLDSLDADDLFSTGSRDGQFTTDGRVAAVGVDGLQLIDVDGEEPVVDDVGVGRDAVSVAFDADRGIAATSDGSGDITLWDVDSGQQIGPSFSPLGGERPRWIGFAGGGHLVVGGRIRSAVVSIDEVEWLNQACALVEALDPDGSLPADPRLRELAPCP